jgi:deoxycytidylate deaminase
MFPLPERRFFVEAAQLASRCSPSFNKCGAVITAAAPAGLHSSAIVATGFNYADPGKPVDDVNGTHVVHAEVAALAQLSGETRGQDMYVIMAPCVACACAILASGRIGRVFHGMLHPNPVYECAKALEVLREGGVETVSIEGL